MKVEIQITPSAHPPHAVIYTAALSDEVEKAVELLSGSPRELLSGESAGSYYALKPDEIVLIRIESGKTIAYTADQSYLLQQRLYQLEAHFLRISKSALINLQQLDHVEPSFNGLMLGVMKNGSQEYISRKYLPELKKRLGIGGK